MAWYNDGLRLGIIINSLWLLIMIPSFIIHMNTLLIENDDNTSAVWIKHREVVVAYIMALLIPTVITISILIHATWASSDVNVIGAEIKRRDEIRGGLTEV